MKFSLLDGYKVLDLTDEKGFACGFILAMLGAEVIKVEKPGGSSCRNMEPFYQNKVNPQTSLFWFGYNTNTKSITLDIEKWDGREIFKRLVKKADVVIESFSPGYMEKLSLGYPSLESLNQGIILTSITPFGQYGPFKDNNGSDIVIWAESGVLNLTGDIDRPPLQTDQAQSYFMASLYGAEGTVVAIYYRGVSGRGQWIDAAALDSICPAVTFETAFWELQGEIVSRKGQLRRRGKTYARMLWPCKDGQVSFSFTVGRFGYRLIPLVEWMNNEGMAGSLAEVQDWTTVDFEKLTPEKLKVWEDSIINFFLRHTKTELTEFGQKHGIFLMPSKTPQEIVDDHHLEVRKFWEEVEHSEISDVIRYPGPPYRFSEGERKMDKRAPLIGEHNEEIYQGELGLPAEQLILLRENGII